MSAPSNAEAIGGKDLKAAVQRFCKDNGEDPPEVECWGCGWEGNVLELLGVDPDEETTMWCPMCGTSVWVYK